MSYARNFEGGPLDVETYVMLRLTLDGSLDSVFLYLKLFHELDSMFMSELGRTVNNQQMFGW